MGTNSHGKRRWIAALAVTLAAALVGVGYYLFAPRRTPIGQPALSVLAPESLKPLREQFNASAGVPRVIALLSPT